MHVYMGAPKKTGSRIINSLKIVKSGLQNLFAKSAQMYLKIHHMILNLFCFFLAVAVAGAVAGAVYAFASW